MAGRNLWTEEETILAYYYYCQIPFGKINKTHPDIVRIAALINRTPSAVAYKMGNLAHYDPSLQARNVKGWSNGSKRDREVFLRFSNDWETLTLQAREIENGLQEKMGMQPMDINFYPIPEGQDRVITTTTRINQDFFRRAVLSSYENTCCITGIHIPELLIASHIKPWRVSDHKKERTNPGNGLCLNALHDKAFDSGLITVLPDYTIRVSSKLGGHDEGIEWLKQCDRSTINLPKRFLPDRVFLEYHNDVVFVP